MLVAQNLPAVETVACLCVQYCWDAEIQRLAEQMLMPGQKLPAASVAAPAAELRAIQHALLNRCMRPAIMNSRRWALLRELWFQFGIGKLGMSWHAMQQALSQGSGGMSNLKPWFIIALVAHDGG